MLVTAAQVTSDRHAKRSGKRRTSVARTVAIMFALRPQKKPVKPAVLPHRVKAVEPTGKHFVHVALVTHIHHEPVAWCIEHAMQRNRQLDHTKIRPEMSAS